MTDGSGDVSAPPRSTPFLLCLHGSPRKDGNTDRLLAALGAGAAEAGLAVEHLRCSQLAVRPCSGCGACAQTGHCAIRDGMERVYAAVDQAAAVAVGAPVYFLGLPAQIKTVIDRFQCRWSQRYELGMPPGDLRPGAFLSTAGAPAHSVFTCAQQTVRALFDVVDVTCDTNLLYPNVDGRGAIDAHPVALDEARDAGAKLARLSRGEKR